MPVTEVDKENAPPDASSRRSSKRTPSASTPSEAVSAASETHTPAPSSVGARAPSEGAERLAKDKKDKREKDKSKRDKKERQRASDDGGHAAVAEDAAPTVPAGASPGSADVPSVAEGLSERRAVPPLELVEGPPDAGGSGPSSSRPSVQSPAFTYQLGGPQLIVDVKAASPVSPNAFIVHPFVRVWLLEGSTGMNLAIRTDCGLGAEACGVTHPFDIRSRQCRAPLWEQEIAVDLMPEALQPHRDPVVLLELLDFGAHTIQGAFCPGRAAQLYPIAWGFVRLFPGHGRPINEQLFHRDVHVQLFSYAERASLLRRAAAAVVPTCLAHAASLALGSAAPIAANSVVPHVYRTFCDAQLRRLPYPGGITIRLRRHMEGSYLPRPVQATPYESALEEALLMTFGGRGAPELADIGAAAQQKLALATHAAADTGSKYARMDFTRRRDERSLPPNAVVHRRQVRGRVTAVALCPHNRLLAVASAASFNVVVEVFDIQNALFPAVAVLRGHADTVHAVTFNPAADLLATGGADKTVRVWDISTLPRIVDTSEAEEAVCLASYSHGFNVYGVVFALDALIVAGYDTHLHIWRVPTPADRGGGLITTAAHPDTAFFAFLRGTDYSKVWTIDSRHHVMLWRIDFDAHDRFEAIHLRRRLECPGAVSVDVHGHVGVVSCPSAQCVLVLDTMAFVVTHRIMTGSRTSRVPATILPDGKLVVVGSATGRLLAWEAATADLCTPRDGCGKAAVPFPIDCLVWGTNQLCAVASFSEADRGGGHVAVLGRPRREGDVVNERDPRANDLVRAMFGGDVALRPQRVQQPSPARAGLPGPPRGGSAGGAGRMQQILGYWSTLVQAHREPAASAPAPSAVPPSP